MASFRLDKQTEQAFEKTLQRLELSVRGKTAKAVLRKSGNVFAKEYRKRIARGDKKHTPELKQIHKLISTKVIDYNNGTFVAVSGVRKSRKGDKVEGWYQVLVEEGFKHYGTKAHVPGKPALMYSDMVTRQRRMQIIRDELSKALEEAARG